MAVIITLFILVVSIGVAMDYKTHRHKKRVEKHYREYKNNNIK